MIAIEGRLSQVCIERRGNVNCTMEIYLASVRKINPAYFYIILLSKARFMMVQCAV